MKVTKEMMRRGILQGMNWGALCVDCPKRLTTCYDNENDCEMCALILKAIEAYPLETETIH